MEWITNNKTKISQNWLPFNLLEPYTVGRDQIFLSWYFHSRQQPGAYYRPGAPVQFIAYSDSSSFYLNGWGLRVKRDEHHMENFWEGEKERKEKESDWD